MQTHHANLNLYYWLPIWDYRVPLICSRLPGWTGERYYWFRTFPLEKHITAVEEPSGFSLHAAMDAEEWVAWLNEFKRQAQNILGYKVGEIELGEVGHKPEWIQPELRIFEDINTAIDQCDTAKAEQLYEAPKPYFTELDILAFNKTLFRQTWHGLHDRIVSDFQASQHPRLATFLYQQIRSGTIPEFDYKPVSRRDIWTLADIGTTEAKTYLTTLAQEAGPPVQGFAQRRLNRWETELERKGRRIPSQLPHAKRIRLEPYPTYRERIPSEGAPILAYQTDEHIVLYQAYNPAIAAFAVAEQRLGGPGFSWNRMSWVKPNYLWMMYRSGWATKPNQERILAIRIRKADWSTILRHGVLSSFNPDHYPDHATWKRALTNSEVRIQWDPDHDPFGTKLVRRAIQVGMKGETLRHFGQDLIVSIEDITPFVARQRLYVELKDLDHLEVPRETVFANR